MFLSNLDVTSVLTFKSKDGFRLVSAEVDVNFMNIAHDRSKVIVMRRPTLYNAVFADVKPADCTCGFGG